MLIKKDKRDLPSDWVDPPDDDVFHIEKAKRARRFLNHLLWFNLIPLLQEQPSLREKEEALRFLRSKDGRGLMIAAGYRPKSLWRNLPIWKEWLRDNPRGKRAEIKDRLLERVAVMLVEEDGLTIPTIAERLNCTQDRVWCMLKRSGVQAPEVDRSLRIKDSELPAWLQEYLGRYRRSFLHKKKQEKRKTMLRKKSADL